MPTLVLMRHGESVWNLENRFTGWVDVDLTENGLEQAFTAGKLLQKNGFDFDIAYTSVLKRAIRTLWGSLDAMDRMWLPTIYDWRLNERHYGNLQGLNKSETALKYGEEQVLLWRRSYTVAPGSLGEQAAEEAMQDPRYAGLARAEIPLTECLRDTVARVLPLWHESIAPVLKTGKRVLISAHGNSLRALVKYLEQISDEDILHLNIPNAEPLVYQLNDKLEPIEKFTLR